MKTNSRKKLLVSSVAMLLVAMLALGTATYAWFTSSTTATANGINVMTTKASELQISSVGTDWGTLIDYGVQNKVLLPASTANGVGWWKAEAANRDDFAAKEGTINAIAEADRGAYRFKDQLNVRNNGEADVENVKITFSVPNNYLRVALVETNGRGENLENTGVFKNSVFAIDDAPYDAIAGKADTIAITPDATGTLTIGTLTSGEAKYYNLFVWFEGQDPDCKDTNAGAIIDDIKFTVHGETAKQN